MNTQQLDKLTLLLKTVLRSTQRTVRQSSNDPDHIGQYVVFKLDNRSPTIIPFELIKPHLHGSHAIIRHKDKLFFADRKHNILKELFKSDSLNSEYRDLVDSIINSKPAYAGKKMLECIRLIAEDNGIEIDTSLYATNALNRFWTRDRIEEKGQEYWVSVIYKKKVEEKRVKYVLEEYRHQASVPLNTNEDAKIQRELLRQKPEYQWLDKHKILLEMSAAHIIGFGNCGIMNGYALLLLWEYHQQQLQKNQPSVITRLEIVFVSHFDHGVILVNRLEGTSLRNPKEWGANCMVLDTWWGATPENHIFSAELFTEKMRLLCALNPMPATFSAQLYFEVPLNQSPPPRELLYACDFHAMNEDPQVTSNIRQKIKNEFRDKVLPELKNHSKYKAFFLFSEAAVEKESNVIVSDVKPKI